MNFLERAPAHRSAASKQLEGIGGCSVAGDHRRWLGCSERHPKPQNFYEPLQQRFRQRQRGLQVTLFHIVDFLLENSTCLIKSERAVGNNECVTASPKLRLFLKRRAILQHEVSLARQRHVFAMTTKRF